VGGQRPPTHLTASAPLAILALLLLTACEPPPPVRYVVGEPYQMGGVWSYPRETFSFVQTGLASVAAGSSGGFTANGEPYERSRATAAHRTLQLPSVVSVTNLETGRTLLVRVNDRGPANPGRVLELSPRAAELLGVPAGGAAQVRLEVEPALSRAVATQAAGREVGSIAIEAAPRGEVASESLAPPPGAREAAPRAAAPPQRAAAEDAPAAAGPVAIPETVTQGPPSPGQLYVEAASFFRADLAARQAARIPGARVEPFGEGGTRQYRVRVGPLQDARSADTALERTLAAGVSEARILVD